MSTDVAQPPAGGRALIRDPRGLPLAVEEAAPGPVAARRPWRLRLGVSRRPASRPGWAGFLLDWTPIVALLVAYELMRDLVPLLGTAPRDLAGIDRWIFGGPLATTSLQAGLYRPALVSPWDVVASAVYFMHFVLPAAVGLYLWLGDRSRFQAFAASLLVVSCLAFVTYVAMPTLPPWLGHPGEVHKVIDETIAKLRIPPWLLGAYSHHDYNVDAAFPSLHSAFPLVAAVHVWRRNRWPGLLLAAWTALVWLSVVYLGEHYVVDVLGGIAYAGAGLLLVAGWRRVTRARRGPAGPGPSPPDLGRLRLVEPRGGPGSG